MSNTSKKKYRKRTLLIVVIGALIVFRLMLPTMVKNYVNKVLADLPGYTGAVEDIDISLYRGAYVIKGMYLNVVDAETEVPFLDLGEVDISIEWKSLFKGEIVSEIIINDPKVIYVLEDQEGEQEADVEDWTKALTDLVPLDVNHLEVHRGSIALVGVQAEPNIDLQMNNLELFADNLSNVVAKTGELPSEFHATASTFGAGNFEAKGRLDLLHEIPEMDLTFSLEKSDAKALNDLTKHYAGIDFEEGEFNLYGEMALADAFLTGYVKPFIKDSRLVGSSDPFPNIVWEGFVGMFKFILKNQRRDTLAMKVPFEGSIEDVGVNSLDAFFSILRNAFIKAFEPGSDGEIDFEDALDNDEEKSRKERRQEKKEAKE